LIAFNYKQVDKTVTLFLHFFHMHLEQPKFELEMRHNKRLTISSKFQVKLMKLDFLKPRFLLIFIKLSIALTFFLDHWSSLETLVLI